MRMCQCRSTICLCAAADNGIVPSFDLLVILKACRYSTDLLHLVSLRFHGPDYENQNKILLTKVKESQVKKFVMSSLMIHRVQCAYSLGRLVDSTTVLLETKVGDGTDSS